MENKNLEGQFSFDGQLEGSDASAKNKTEEFEIGKPKEKDNLVFEVEKLKEEEKIAADPIVEEFIMGATPEALKAVEPEIAEPSAETATEPDVPQKKIPIYIPRFTEASEKYRKMIDTRTMSSAKDPRYASKNAYSESADENIDYSDPTAEIDTEPENQVVVSVSAPAPEPDVLKVFKFAGETPPEAEPIKEIKQEAAIPYEPTFEEELKNIERLIAGEPKVPDAETVDVPDFEETLGEAVQEDTPIIEAPSELLAKAEEDYVLPDPVNLVHVEEFAENSSRVKEEPTPDCVRDEEPTSDKKGTSEFTHQTQRDSFKDRFLDSIMAVKIRLGAIGIFSLLILIYELLAFSGTIPVTVFSGSGFAGTLAALDLIFAACVFLLAIPETVKAIKHLTGGVLIPEICLLAEFIVIAVYSTVVMFFPESSYPLYGFIFAVSAISAVFATYYRTLGDFTAFKQVSQNAAKKVLDVSLTRELEDENVALDGLIDEYNSKTSRIYRAAFVTDFFKRTSEPVINNQRTAVILGVPFVAAVVAAVVCFFIPGGIVSSMSALALVFLLGCPAFAALANKISYFDSQETALSEESTVLGEKSYYDFSEVDVIAFEDTEIFGTEDVKLKRFMLYGDRDNIEKAMRQMYSLFSAVGGPLYKVFSNALDNRVRHATATDVEIEADGICGNVSGTRIFAGNDEYMRRHGIPLPAVASQSDFGIDTTKILYAAEAGEVYAKFYIRYSFSEEFTMLLPEMKRDGIVPLIYTNDPNLSNELLKTLSAGADCMRVVKKFEPRVDTEKTYRRVSAGVVTYGDKINAINTILLTRKYKEFADSVNITELYAVSIAAAAGALISVLGVGLPSLAFGLWQAVWCVGLRLVSRKTLIPEKKEDK